MTRTRIFWSIYFILLGIILLIKILFRLTFSGWTMAFALLMLESGIFLLTGGFGLGKTRHARGGGDYVFFSGNVQLEGQSPRLSAVGSNVVVDLTAPPASLTSINCLMANVTVRLPQGYSLRTVCTTAFGDIRTPKGSLAGFGDRVFVFGDGLQSQMEVHCLFGQVTILD